MTVEDQTMRDFTAGHISTEEAARAAGHGARATRQRRACNSVPASAIAICSIYRGGEAAGRPSRADTRHDAAARSDRQIGARRLSARAGQRRCSNQLMSDSVALFADHPVNVERRAAGKAAGHERLAVGTRARAGAQAVRRSLRQPRGDDHGRRSAARAGRADRLAADRRARRDRLSRHRLRRQGAVRRSRRSQDTDLICVHVEATDEASHEGDARGQGQGPRRDRPAHRRPAARGAGNSTATIASWSRPTIPRRCGPRRTATARCRLRSPAPASRPTRAQTYDEVAAGAIAAGVRRKAGS